MFRFKERERVQEDAAAATSEEDAAKAAEEAAKKAEEEKKKAEEEAKKAAEEAAKKKAEEMKKQIDELQKKIEEAQKKADEEAAKALEEAEKAEEEKEKALAEQMTKDEANSTAITDVLVSSKEVRAFMDEGEFKEYMGKLQELQTKTLKRQMQEQAESDIKEMIAAALSDPLISGKKRGVKNNNRNSLLQNKKTGPEYAINKMTEEV